MQYEQEDHVPHCHGFDEIVFVLKGSGVHVVDNDEYPYACKYNISVGFFSRT